jgi:stage V sporulation protein R
MEDWQRDIFEIIRQESFYFYPQYCTKILNEGIASVIHEIGRAHV